MKRGTATSTWTTGLPIAGLLSVAIGFLSRGHDWLWAFAIAPTQVLTMMARSGEAGLWPLALILSGILGLPFVAGSFVGSRIRPRRPPLTPRADSRPE